MPNGKTEIVKFQLPDGSIQPFEIPSGLSDSEARTFVLSKRPDLFQSQPSQPQKATMNASQATGIGPNAPGPQTPTMFDPYNLRGAASWIAQGQNLTQQGQQEHPIQAAIGKLAGMAVGGEQGIGTSKQGFITNPVTGMLLGASPGKAIASTAGEFAPSAMKAAAGQTIGTIKSVAGKIPVNTGPVSQPLLELFTEYGYGAQLPTPARKLLLRLTAKEGAPLTLEEAKGFQSQVTDFLKNPVGANGARIKDLNTFRLMGNVNQALKDMVESGSQLGGFEPGTFSEAMQQYHLAGTREAMMQRIHDLAVKGIKFGAGAAGLGALGGLGYDVYKLFSPGKSGQ